VNLSATTALSRDWKLVAKLDNLTDKVYQTAGTYASARRTLYVGLTWAPRFDSGQGHPCKPVRCPAILIAAPASGQGKTTVACALARLHARQGRRVRVFKCGPDFLDPCWHALASGAPVYQMDLWMTGEADCSARLHAAAQEADLIIVEGVMGLFDGEPSAADLAQRFGLPVLAVVDASGMVAPLARWPLACSTTAPHALGRGAGQPRGQCAPCGHAAGQRRANDQWLGAVLRNAAMSLPKRHLGLTVATEVTDAMERLDAAADALATTPLGQMTLEDLQRWAVDFTAPLVKSPAPFTCVPALAGQDDCHCARRRLLLYLRRQPRHPARAGRRAGVFLAAGRCGGTRLRRAVDSRRLPRTACTNDCGQHRAAGQPGRAHRRGQTRVGRVRRHDGAV
jgi:hypothetical protein